MAGPFSISGKIDGLQPLINSLQHVKRSMRNKVLRRMVRRGSALTSKAAKVAAKRVQIGSNVATHEKIYNRAGLIAKSMGVKIKTNTANVLGIVGPRVGFAGQVGVTKKHGPVTGNPPGTPIIEDPAKIAHLVEFGHGGPHPAPPHPIMRPAFESTKSEAQAVMADEAARGLAEAAKGG